MKTNKSQLLICQLPLRLCHTLNLDHSEAYINYSCMFGVKVHVLSRHVYRITYEWF